MSEFITLVGAEDVSRAGSSIRTAAITMQGVAGQIEESLNRHRMFLDDWIFRFEEAIGKLKEVQDDSN